MIKNKNMIISTILSLTFFIFLGINTRVESVSEDVNIDLLIENKKNQEELEAQILKLEEEIKNKMNLMDEAQMNNDNVQVVTVSFVEDQNLVETNEDVENNIELEIMKLKGYKDEIKKELESYIIESVKLEKNIEKEKQNYLAENSVEYISCLWPLESYRTISSPFGDRIHPITGKKTFHKGIDIPAPQNTDILAVDDGIVTFSGVQNGYGNVIKIKHFDGKETVYAHNTSNIAKEGDIVKMGSVIAKVGTTGNSTGNHIHFETIINGENINPENVATR
ncbi:MAG: peptidoglycan DD-metalloendopeptidase family protein [Peptostreptococcaceae bacterium]